MKPQILKGTRDFLPSQVYKRNYIFDTIKSVFQKYGYLPIETPVMEHLSTLTGKYGEEGDKLLFKLLNNGDFLAKANKEALSTNDSNKLIPSISKRGLRYDLTVPFARFVVMHQNDLSFPFKRYQIQPVWRADRPQKGRYQEFYQCDVDVVGSDSLLYEAELIQIYDEVFTELNIKTTIKINNRKILFGLAEFCDCQEYFIEMVNILDKLDKKSRLDIENDLINIGIDPYNVNTIFECLDIEADYCNDQICYDCLQISIDELYAQFPKFYNQVCKILCLEYRFRQKNCTQGMMGTNEIITVFKFLEKSMIKHPSGNSIINFDLSLARGLSYYTGFIVEVSANDAEMGSIGGGGRYDDLTSSFGMKDMSGIGVSFGAERIYDVMEELDLFPKDVTQSTQVILLSFDEDALVHASQLANELREANIATEVYPSAAKMKKQMKYANERGIPYVIVIGSQEMESGSYKLKNMLSGDQQEMDIASIINTLSAI